MNWRVFICTLTVLAVVVQVSTTATTSSAAVQQLSSTLDTIIENYRFIQGQLYSLARLYEDVPWYAEDCRKIANQMAQRREELDNEPCYNFIHSVKTAAALGHGLVPITSDEDAAMFRMLKPAIQSRDLKVSLKERQGMDEVEKLFNAPVYDDLNFYDLVDSFEQDAFQVSDMLKYGLMDATSFGISLGNRNFDRVRWAVVSSIRRITALQFIQCVIHSQHRRRRTLTLGFAGNCEYKAPT
jgi:hypothetical protein